MGTKSEADKRVSRIPSAAGRIVNLGVARGIATGVHAPHDQHRAVGQQRRGVALAFGVQRTGRSPVAGGWVIQFRAVQGLGVGVHSAHDQDLAIGQ